MLRMVRQERVEEGDVARDVDVDVGLEDRWRDDVLRVVGRKWSVWEGWVGIVILVVAAPAAVAAATTAARELR